MRSRAWERVPEELRELRIDELTLPELLLRQRREHADRPLLHQAGATLDVARVVDGIAGRAGALAAGGIRRGDRVAIMAPNSAGVLELVLAAAWLGAIAVMLNPAARGAQLRHLIEAARASLLVVAPDAVEHLTAIEPAPGMPRAWLLGDAQGDAGRRLAVERQPAPSGPVEPADVGPGDAAVIIFTSGTTGPAKGVLCGHGQLFWWGINTGWNLELTPGDRLYTNLPLFHTNALSAFMQALLFGSSFAVGERFSASRFWSRLAEAEATVTFLLGAMVRILVQRPRSELMAHRVRVALSPATPPELHDAFRARFGVRLVEAYGSTETNHVIGELAGRHRPGWMGRPLPGFEARVVDELDAPVPAGTAGELVLRTDEPHAFSGGYDGLPEATIRAWRNLWFHTGDQVVADADGRVRFLDRLTDSIRRRGENISSYEVEQAIAEHSSIASVAVYAVPSELAEDEVMAAVVPRPGIDLDPRDMVAFLESRLASHAIPRFVEIVDELPLTPNGKVRKALLKERGVGPRTWDARR